jgi:chromatin structure-remodeling complex subunit RSC9
MAPKPDPKETTDFIQKLTEYHVRRGTQIDPWPRVSTKQIDLLHLVNTVVGYGGYDRVSDEKLAWRRIATEFGLPTQNLPAVAFSLKTVYYKNLAAYEISTIHKKEPPPKEILEDQTAKGGGLLTRTMENYPRKPTRDEHSEASGDDGTPAREQNGSEETPGSGGRVTRGLRQAPPQRILFQPDTGPARAPSRHISNSSHAPSPQHANHQHHQPQPPRGASTSYNPSSNTDNISLAVANYEPRFNQPMTLRPVITPGNNPAEFARRQQALENQLAGKPIVSRPSGISLPGSKFSSRGFFISC